MPSTRRLALSTLAVLFLNGCYNKEIPTGPDCTETPLDLPVTAVTDASSCVAADGQVTVTAGGGVPPYMYSLNHGTFQANPAFTGLTAGTYPVTVQDSRGCTSDSEVTVNAEGSTLQASALSSEDTQCFPPHDGSLSVTPAGGTPPYEVKLDNGAFGSVTSFSGLVSGNYSVVVRDAENCTVTLGITVARGDTGVSFASEIAPILNASCNFSSCHGAGNGSRSFTSYSNVAAKAAFIKLRTGNLSMPPPGSADLTAAEIQRIACWVDDGAKNN